MPALLLLALLSAATAGETVPVLGGPCEGCDSVFVGQPANPPAHARIAPAEEPGETLRIEGCATRAGAAAPGVIVYAYHTDATGHYPRAPGVKGDAGRHGRLRGWATTDAQGCYRFDTIRPAGYPGRKDPAHVHMHVIEPARGTYWIDDIWFEDDARLTPAQRERAQGRGGPGIVSPKRDDAGVWQVRRDIALGQGIADYPH